LAGLSSARARGKSRDRDGKAKAWATITIQEADEALHRGALAVRKVREHVEEGPGSNEATEVQGLQEQALGLD